MVSARRLELLAAFPNTSQPWNWSDFYINFINHHGADFLGILNRGEHSVEQTWWAFFFFFFFFAQAKVMRVKVAIDGSWNSFLIFGKVIVILQSKKEMLAFSDESRLFYVVHHSYRENLHIQIIILFLTKQGTFTDPNRCPVFDQTRYINFNSHMEGFEMKHLVHLQE